MSMSEVNAVLSNRPEKSSPSRPISTTHPTLTHTEEAKLNRLLGGTATVQDALELYESVVTRVKSFPLDWEAAIVRLSLEREPGRPDLVERLRVIQSALSRDKPGSDGVTTDVAVGAEPAISTDVITVAPFEDLPIPNSLGLENIEQILTALEADPKFHALAAYFDRASTRSLLSATAQTHLYCAVRRLRPGTVVEIGTYHAGTSETIARALASNGAGRLHTLSPHHGARIRQHMAAWPGDLSDRVVYHEANSAEFFQNFAESGLKVDLYLIDGNHDFEFVLFDLFAAARCANRNAQMFLDNISQPGVYWAAKTFLRSYPEWTLLGLSKDADGPAELFNAKRSSITGTDFAILKAPSSFVLQSGRCYAPGLRRTSNATAAGIRFHLAERSRKSTRISYQLILRETASLVEKIGAGRLVIDSDTLEYRHLLDTPLSVSEAAGGAIFIELVLAVDDERPMQLLLEDEPEIIIQ
jgi:predicted O-methyltransferase YrrM